MRWQHLFLNIPLPTDEVWVRTTVSMPQLISAPTRITAAGNKPKIIEEFIGRVNSGEQRLSIASMRSPSGWVEPGQTPEFDEFTLVLKGSLRVTHTQGVMDVSAGQAVIARAGEWVQYSSPSPEGAECVAICLPAFAPGTVHRDSPEQQMALYEKELKENDWGHQPC